MPLIFNLTAPRTAVPPNAGLNPPRGGSKRADKLEPDRQTNPTCGRPMAGHAQSKTEREKGPPGSNNGWARPVKNRTRKGSAGLESTPQQIFRKSGWCRGQAGPAPIQAPRRRLAGAVVPDPSTLAGEVGLGSARHGVFRHSQGHGEVS